MQQLQSDIPTPAIHGQESLYACVRDLQRSEKKYNEQLTSLSDLYIIQLRTYVVTSEELEKMLLNRIKDCIEISASMYEKMEEKLKNWDESNSRIGDIFLQNDLLWETYRHFSSNLELALEKYDEKMATFDFASLISTTQDMDTVSLRDLILMPIGRLKSYQQFFGNFLEKSVNANNALFSHSDFNDVMKCKEKVKGLIPTNYEDIIKRRQVDGYRRIEALLVGDVVRIFSNYIVNMHEEPENSKQWNRKSYKRNKITMSESLSSEQHSESFEIGGRKYREETIAPDILNALKREEERQIMIGMVSPKRPKNSACDFFVGSEEKVKVRWESEVHNYNLHLFKQCLVFGKTKNNRKTMKISRIVKLRNMWVTSYTDSLGFGQVEKQENCFIGGWLATEGLADDEILQRAIFHFPNKNLKNHWLVVMRRHIHHARDGLPRNGSIKVYFKGSDSTLSSVPSDRQGMACQELSIGLQDTVEEVIKGAVGRFQMKDAHYTLKFIIRDGSSIEAEESLISTELPLLIQMDTLSSLQFKENKNIEVLFVLRHNSLGLEPVAPLRSRTATLTTLFWKAGGRGARPAAAASATSSHLPSSPGGQASPGAGKMFGLSLSRFMPAPEQIPAPLLDLLLYIYTACYESDGIFRIPGNKKQQLRLEERLDAGEAVDWLVEQTSARCHVPRVAASVLKNYYRTLPEGLFPMDLFPEFERWRGTAEGEREEEMRGILAQVPERNSTLIRYTFHTLKRVTNASEVNKMTLEAMAISIGPSLVQYKRDDSRALSIIADGERARTGSDVVAFLLERVTDFFGPVPAIFQKTETDETSLSRRSIATSKFSMEMIQNESSGSEDEGEGEKNNTWIRSLMIRSSMNEHDSRTSSMMVELGSPGSKKSRSVSPPVTPLSHTLLKSPAVQTAHSEALQVPSSVEQEQCSVAVDVPSESTPTETKTFFPRLSKKSRNAKSENASGEQSVAKKKGTSLRRSKKNKDQKKEESSAVTVEQAAIAVEQAAAPPSNLTPTSTTFPSVSDMSSEDENGRGRTDRSGGRADRTGGSVFTRHTRVIREKGPRTKPVAVGPVPDPAKATTTPSRDTVPPLRQVNSLGRTAIAAERKSSDGIQKIKEHPGARRVLVPVLKREPLSIPVNIYHSARCEQVPGSYGGMSPVSPGPTTPSGDQDRAASQHDLPQLRSNLEKLTSSGNLRINSYRIKKFGAGSVGTESGTSSCDDENLMEQESYV